MKKLFFILGIVLLISCNRSNEYLIIGEVENVPDSIIIDLYQNYADMASRINSDTIIDGKFKFSGSLETRPSKMTLRIRNDKDFYGACEIWADYTKIKVSGNGKYLSSWKIKSNVTEQKSHNSFQELSSQHLIALDSLILLRMNNRNDKDFSSSLRQQMDSIAAIKNSLEFEFIKENYNSYSAIEKLYRISKFSTVIEKYEISEVYNQIDTLYKNTLYGQGIKSSLTEIKVPKVGDKMIDIEAFDINGISHKLSSYQDNYILLDFWSMACYPCLLAAPELRELNSKYQKNLKIVGLNLDTKKELWIKGAERDSITWTNLSDGKGNFAGASVSYGVNGMPTYVLINPDGIIIERWSGFSKGIFEDKIEKYLIEKDN